METVNIDDLVQSVLSGNSPEEVMDKLYKLHGEPEETNTDGDQAGGDDQDPEPIV